MNYFLIGIKGSGMASLAHILLDLGNEVSGSDIDQYIFTQDSLEKRHVPIYPFDAKNIKPGMTIIIGNSFGADHSEVKKAKELGLTMIKYVEMLQQLMADRYSISIAGTHGKTTTTGLVTQVLNAFEPTGYLIGDGHGHLTEDMKTFVVESCEYRDNYLNYFPNIALINNIELDHVDYFESLEQYLKSFENFAEQTKDSILLNGDDQNVLKLPKEANYRYFGLKEHNDFQARNVEFNDQGIKFDFYTNYYDAEMKKYHTFTIDLFGTHMVMNALAAIALTILKEETSDFTKIEKNLNNFEGVSRRFEIDEIKDLVFIDDYAHHPTAIGLMIDSARQKYPDKKIIAFFKPDRYSRIAKFYQAIAKSLNKADEVYLFDFPANTPQEQGIDISMKDVLALLNNGHLIKEDEEHAKALAKYHDSVFLMMSSKNVYDFKEMIIKDLK
jgi:UDP-N-acetylmuramate--alanine ligase